MTDVDLERRLRGALAARAASVTAQHLRPVVPEHRGARVRWWMPLSAGLAASAVVTMIFVVIHHRPAPPARPIPPVASVPPASNPPVSAPPTSAPSALTPSARTPSRSVPATSGPAVSAPPTAAPGPASPSSSTGWPIPAVTATGTVPVRPGVSPTGRPGQ